MSLTTPPAAPDAPPTAPVRGQRATFSPRMDAFLAWFSPFRTVMASFVTWYTDDAKPELEALQTDVTTKQGLANTASTNAGNSAAAAGVSAAAAAASALTAVNAPGTSGTSTTSTTVGAGTKTLITQTGKAWVVGQPVTLPRTSDPVNTRMWGTISAYNSGTGSISIVVAAGDFVGSGTHTDWTIGLSGQEGPPGADAMLITPTLVINGAATLVAGNNGATCKVVAGSPITLDTLGPTGLYEGWGITLVPDTPASQPVVTADFGAGAETRVIVGTTDLSVQQVSGVYSVRWLPRGNAVPVFGGLGTPAVILAATPTNTSAVAACQISATRSIGFYCTAGSGYPRAALLNATTGAVISTSSDIQATSISGSTPQVVRLSDTHAAAIWASGSEVKAVVLWNNADTIAVGAVFAIEGVTTGAQAIAALTASNLVCVWTTTGGTLRSATLTVSGATLTRPGIIYTLYSGGTPSQCRVAALSATLALTTFVHSGNATTTFGLPLTEAASVLTFPAAPEAVYRAGTSNTVAYSDVCAMTSTMAVVAAGHGKVNSGDAAVMTVTVSGTGASAKLHVGPQRPISTPSSLFSAHRLAKVNASTLLHAFTVDAGPNSGSMSVQALYIEGDAVRPGAAKNIARNVSSHDLAYSTAGRWSAHVIYTDADTSNYQMSQVVNLGSIV